MHGRTHTPVSVPGHTTATTHTPMLDAWMLHNTIQQCTSWSSPTMGHTEHVCPSSILLLHPDNHPFRWHSTSLECTHTDPYSFGAFPTNYPNKDSSLTPAPSTNSYRIPTCLAICTVAYRLHESTPMLLLFHKNNHIGHKIPCRCHLSCSPPLYLHPSSTTITPKAHLSHAV